MTAASATPASEARLDIDLDAPPASTVKTAPQVVSQAKSPQIPVSSTPPAKVNTPSPAVTQQTVEAKPQPAPASQASMPLVRLQPEPQSEPAPELESLSPQSSPAANTLSPLQGQPELEPQPQQTATADEAADKTKTKKEKPIRPVVYYTPLPAIAVFPVIKHGNSHAFSDIPVLFAREFSSRLEQQAPGTAVMNPVYTVESIRNKGLSATYDKVMKDYIYAGRPDPATLGYLIQRLNVGSEKPISRVFFVEADLDTADPMSPKGLGGVGDRIRNVFDNSTPTYMKYYVRGFVQAFDTEDPNMPKVWGFNWRRSVRAERFGNISPSVFSDSDSLRVFRETSTFLSREALLVLPKAVYMDEHIDTSVQGRLAKDAAAEEARQNAGMQPVNDADPEAMGLREVGGKPKRPITETGKHLLNRVWK